MRQDRQQQQPVTESPHAMAHWDWEKNEQAGLHPSKLTWGSVKKTHWVCHTDGQLLSRMWSSRIQDAHVVFCDRRVCATRCRACIPQLHLSGIISRSLAHLDLPKECGGATASKAAFCKPFVNALQEKKQFHRSMQAPHEGFVLACVSVCTCNLWGLWHQSRRSTLPY